SDEATHPVFTYTVPLRDSRGDAYGILGIEISADYLKKLLPPYELNTDNRASYCIARSTGNSDNFCVAASTGMFLKPYASDGTMLSYHSTVDAHGCYQIDGDPKAKVYVSTQYLQLYNSGTPFAADKWALLGIVNKDDLLDFSYDVQSLAAASALSSIIMGIVLTCISIVFITRPIREL
ncbi:MAG: hypothetical protein RRY54_03255, partial [Angelakisella sp.]